MEVQSVQISCHFNTRFLFIFNICMGSLVVTDKNNCKTRCTALFFQHSYPFFYFFSNFFSDSIPSINFPLILIPPNDFNYFSANFDRTPLTKRPDFSSPNVLQSSIASFKTTLCRYFFIRTVVHKQQVVKLFVQF